MATRIGGGTHLNVIIPWAWRNNGECGVCYTVKGFLTKRYKATRTAPAEGGILEDLTVYDEGGYRLAAAEERILLDNQDFLELVRKEVCE